jgi:hypothetical protein
MKKSIALAVVFTLGLSFTACVRNAAAQPDGAQPPVSPSNTAAAASRDTSAADIAGSWNISYAVDEEGVDYPLSFIYGTGIGYGGTLTLNQDGTFSKYIGVTNGDADDYEGNYSISYNAITLEYRNGAVENAVYMPDSDEVRLENAGYSDDMIIYEYFIRQ